MEEEGLAAQESLTCLSCDESNPDCVAGQIDRNDADAIEMSGDSEPIVSMECPAWARSSCFISENEVEKNGEKTMKVNRGCSAFSTLRQCRKVTQEINGEKEVDEICKATCNEDNCNSGKTEDLRDGCYTCSYVEDQSGQMLSGNKNCYDSQPSDEYLQICQPDQICGTSVRIDWLERGAQTITVNRGCQSDDWSYGPDPSDDDNTCIGNAYLSPPASNLFKECRSECEGAACNNQDELAGGDK